MPRFFPVFIPVGVGGGGAAWGSITGTLSSQTDLGAALSAKAALASPTFTGTPAAPTATVGTNTTQVATTAFVQSAVFPTAPLSVSNTSGNQTVTTTDTLLTLGVAQTITIATAGTYLVLGSAVFEASVVTTANANGFYILHLRKNASNVSAATADSYIPILTNVSNFLSTLHTQPQLVTCSASDTISLYIQGNTLPGTGTIIVVGCNLVAIRIQ